MVFSDVQHFVLHFLSKIRDFRTFFSFIIFFYSCLFLSTVVIGSKVSKGSSRSRQPGPRLQSTIRSPVFHFYIEYGLPWKWSNLLLDSLAVCSSLSGFISISFLCIACIDFTNPNDVYKKKTEALINCLISYIY